MRTTSINHPWAISDKFRKKYGDVWANMDFEFMEKISEDSFKTDPMNTIIGYLHVFNQHLKLTYKDLINYSKSIRIASSEAYATKVSENIDVRIKSNTFSLTRHELSKLADTLEEATASTLRAYELGLYL